MSKKLYRVRVREGKDLFRTALLMGKNPKKAAQRSNKGRILSVTKVSMEELLRVGSYFQLGDQLMKEFRKEEASEIKERQQETESKREVSNGEQRNAEGKG